MMRRHATWNSPRSATLVLRFSSLKLAISIQSVIRCCVRCRGPCQDSPAPSSPCLCATAAKGFACRLVSFWFRVSGFWFQAFANFAFLAAKNSTPSLTHSFRPVTDILRYPPMSKINVPRIAFLETGRIIALPIPESNRKEQSSKPLGGGLALPCANPGPPMAQPCLPWVKERSASDERNVGYG